MAERWTPTVAAMLQTGASQAAILAGLDEDVRGLIEELRHEAELPDGDRRVNVDPDKLRIIAASLERLRPVDTPVRARLLATTLRGYGLHRDPTSEGNT